MLKFANPRSVEFDSHRWFTDIYIEDEAGEIHRLRADASSDAGNSLAFFQYWLDDKGREIDEDGELIDE